MGQESPLTKRTNYSGGHHLPLSMGSQATTLGHLMVSSYFYNKPKLVLSTRLTETQASKWVSSVFLRGKRRLLHCCPFSTRIETDLEECFGSPWGRGMGEHEQSMALEGKHRSFRFRRLESLSRNDWHLGKPYQKLSCPPVSASRPVQYHGPA